MYHLIRSIIVFLFTPQQVFLDLGEDAPELFYISIGVRYPGMVLFFPLPLVLPRKEWDERAQKKFGKRPLSQRIQRWLLAGLRDEVQELVEKHEAYELAERQFEVFEHFRGMYRNCKLSWDQYRGAVRALDARGVEDHGWDGMRTNRGVVEVDIATTPGTCCWMSRDQAMRKDEEYGFVAYTPSYVHQ